MAFFKAKVSGKLITKADLQKNGLFFFPVQLSLLKIAKKKDFPASTIAGHSGMYNVKKRKSSHRREELHHVFPKMYRGASKSHYCMRNLTRCAGIQNQVLDENEAHLRNFDGSQSHECSSYRKAENTT